MECEMEIPDPIQRVMSAARSVAKFMAPAVSDTKPLAVAKGILRGAAITAGAATVAIVVLQPQSL